MMAEQTQNTASATYWRRGAIRGLVFAAAFALAFEVMRAMGVGIRLSTPYVVLIGAIGGLAWGLMHAGLRIYLGRTLSRLQPQADAETTQSEDRSHG